MKKMKDNKIYFKLDIKNNDSLIRPLRKLPFISNNLEIRKQRSNEIILMQAKSLLKRLEITHSKKVVLGLSGGLDSTLALIATVEAFKLDNRDLKDIEVITLPAFGTSSLTLNNALKLA